MDSAHVKGGSRSARHRKSEKKGKSEENGANYIFDNKKVVL